MRRALVLVALAAPVLGSAQIVASGAVVPVNPDGAVNDKYINVEECDPASGRTIELQWNVRGASGAGVYRVWASNRAIAASETKCPQDGETEGLRARRVPETGGDILGRGGSTIGTATLPTAEFVTAAGYTCSSGGQTLYVCVAFHPYETGNIPATDSTGVAVGVLELSTSAPAAPGQPTTDPGDERLRVNFTAASGADRYRLVATPVDAAADPGGTRTREVTSSGNYIEGLVNDVTYTVEVVALSIAGNPSPPSPSATGTPRAVDDFWDTYRNANGEEEGGCGLGGAGGLALLGLVALLPRVMGPRSSAARAGFVGPRRRS